MRYLTHLFIVFFSIILIGCTTMPKQPKQLTDTELLYQLRNPVPNANQSEQAFEHLRLLRELFFNRDIAFDNEAMKGLFVRDSKTGGSYNATMPCLKFTDTVYEPNPYTPTNDYVSVVNFWLRNVCNWRVSELEQALGVKFPIRLGQDINRRPTNWAGAVRLSAPEYRYEGEINVDLTGDPRLPDTTISSLGFVRRVFKPQPLK